MAKSKAKREREQAAALEPPPQMYMAPSYYSHELSSQAPHEDPEYFTPYSPSSAASQRHNSYHNPNETWKQPHYPMEAGSTPVAELPGEIGPMRLQPQHPLGHDMHVD